LIPNRFELLSNTSPVSFQKLHDGYSDSMISAEGWIGIVMISGDYPIAEEPEFFTGRYLHELRGVVTDTRRIMAAARHTIRTGESATVSCRINGRPRIGMTIPAPSNRYVILRLFARREDKDL
jgi:hypothetical protein